MRACIGDFVHFPYYSPYDDKWEVIGRVEAMCDLSAGATYLFVRDVRTNDKICLSPSQPYTIVKEAVKTPLEDYL